MIAAVKEGDIKLLEKLLRKGVNLNLLSNNQLFPPPLFQAAELGKIDMMQWFIEKGANLNQISMGQSALERAITADQVEAVEYLLMHGADPNIEYDDITMPTALLTAIKNTSPDINIKKTLPL